MKDVNKMILLGRLGADPVLRHTKTGAPFAHFPVATGRKFKKEDEQEADEWIEETQWHNIVAWGKQGENCAQYLKKGSAVYIEGAVRTRRYEGKDGISRMSYDVHAEEVSFV